MKNKYLRSIIAGTFTVSVMTTSVFTNNILVAYGDTGIEQTLDISKVHSMKVKEEEKLIDLIDSNLDMDLEMSHKANEEVTIIVELESEPVLEHYIKENETSSVHSFIGSSKGKNF